MSSFREWYEERHGVWPGHTGEPIDAVVRRVLDAVADYTDEVTAPTRMPTPHTRHEPVSGVSSHPSAHPDAMDE